MKLVLLGVAAFTVAAVAPLPALAITCRPNTHLTVATNSTGTHVVCAPTMSKTGRTVAKKPPAPKSSSNHTSKHT
jgi:hypothetical protein